MGSWLSCTCAVAAPVLLFLSVVADAFGSNHGGTLRTEVLYQQDLKIKQQTWSHCKTRVAGRERGDLGSCFL